MSVLCLIANPADPVLDAKLVQAIHHETGGEINWLNHGVACEIVQPKHADPVGVARGVIDTRPVDAALVPVANRRKRLLLADMDSTMINEECIDELGAAMGIKDKIAEITDSAMRGEIDFAGALRLRVGLLKGLTKKQVEEVRRERITLAPGGRALVQTMKAYGAYTALISGGFTFFADHFGKRIGFDEVTANVLNFDADGVLDGTVSDPIVGKDAKINRLNHLIETRGIPAIETMAVGDGANDLGMIRGSGLGVALHAKPIVAAEAAVRIDHGDLTALLYLQGYAEDEFVL